MNILITGANGFLGKNLTENVKTIQGGQNKTRPQLHIEEIYEFTRQSSEEELREYCRKADFIFHLAGVNRIQKTKEEFREGNIGFAEKLVQILEECGSKAPVVYTSSIQASLVGRFAGSEYGQSKRDAEEVFCRYAEKTGNRVLVYRLPNLVGKWIKPEYNSAIGTFCHHIANDMPITVRDPDLKLDLLFVEDLIEEFYDAMEGKEHRCEYPADGEVIGKKRYDGVTPFFIKDGGFCASAHYHRVSMGYAVQCLKTFRDQPKTRIIPDIPEGSFEKKLYSMYLSYLPEEKTLFDLPMHADNRGSFTELLKTNNCGQVSVNISKPGITKGQHWHNRKWEFFIVVSGHALIQERRIGVDEQNQPYPVREFRVSGDQLQAVHMLPGYTHNIINLSDTQDLVTIMWANEPFNPEKPDTFFQEV